MSKHFRNFFYFITLLILAVGFLLWSSYQISFTEKEIESINFKSYFKFKREKPEIIPGFMNLEIPFIPQAPYAVWDELHDHACEEAAIIMVYYYLTGKDLIKEIAEQEILNMVDWQIKNWGGHFDLSVEQIGQLFRDYFNYENIELVYDFEIEDIKKELAAGNPIVIPAAGRILGNPYFTPPGPEYHILIIKGYDDEKSEFITNDPGTRRGADSRYNYQVLENAIHDFNNGDVLDGKKVMIIVKK